MCLKQKTYSEKRFFEWSEDEVSVTLRNKGGSYGGGSECFAMQAIGEYKKSDSASALKQRDYKDATDLVREDMNKVRRLTPTECERLQGFPDGWTDIGEWEDENGKKHKEADSPRYKAIGNSIATPFWFSLLRRISACYERPATMGSLFSGIGGFEYCWEMCNGKGTALWASEIEPFCVAVTKKHFPEEDDG